jgi:hypothetical protein
MCEIVSAVVCNGIVSRYRRKVNLSKILSTKRLVIWVVALIAINVDSWGSFMRATDAFQLTWTRSVVQHCRKQSTSLTVALSFSRNDNEEIKTLRPETAFGSDAVPMDQRPVNEFLDVTSQPMFGWASTQSGNVGLLLRLLILYGIMFATVCYPIAGATYTQSGFEIQKIVAANVGDLLFILFILIRLYSGWAYIGSRLTSSVIEYEETGWYDGDFERKSKTELARDRMLYTNQVQPVVERLRWFTIVTAALWLVTVGTFQLVSRENPIFNEYDPTLLEQVQYDDDLAQFAAQKSGNQPTYCNNRYYKALAGGGQGCD